ncbi:MAG: hypothetical protein HYX22_02165 [Candidatus Yanofskybacteria bacterium]|nr:hypothetical protein [Candidatus Yanofskybacteria bacterium]
MVKIPKIVQKEIELLLRGKRKTRKEPIQVNREELVKRALKVIELINEIARIDLVKKYLALMDIKIFGHHPWNIVITGLGAIPGCYARFDIDRYMEHKRDYVEMKNRDSFHFWSIDELDRFSSLTERQIWKIILEWVQAHRERI